MPKKITSLDSSELKPPAVLGLSPEAKRLLNTEQANRQRFTEIVERGQASYLEKDKKSNDRLKHVSRAIDVAIIVIGLGLAVIPFIQTQLWWTPLLQMGVVFGTLPILIYIDYKAQTKQRRYETHSLLQPMLLPNKQLPALHPVTEADIPMMDPSLKWDRINKDNIFTNIIVEFEDSREIVHAAQNYDLEISIPLKVFAAAKIGQINTDCKNEWEKDRRKVSFLNKHLKVRVLETDKAYKKYTDKENGLKQEYQKLFEGGDFSEEYADVDKKLEELMSMASRNDEDYAKEATAFFADDREKIKKRMVANLERFVLTIQKLEELDRDFFQRLNKDQRESLGIYDSISEEAFSQLSLARQSQEVQQNNAELCFGIHNPFSKEVFSQLPLETQLHKGYAQIKDLVRDRYEKYLDEGLVSKKFYKIEEKLDLLRDLYSKDQDSYETKKAEFLKDDYGLIKLTLVFELEKHLYERQKLLDLARDPDKLQSLFLNNEFSIELQLFKAKERMLEKVDIFHAMYLDQGGDEDGFQEIMVKLGVLLNLKLDGETMNYTGEKWDFIKGRHRAIKGDFLSELKNHVQFCLPLVDLIQDIDRIPQLLSKDPAIELLMIVPKEKARENYQKLQLLTLQRYENSLEQEFFSQDLNAVQDTLNALRNLSKEDDDKEYEKTKATFLEQDHEGIKEALIFNLERSIALDKKLTDPTIGREEEIHSYFDVGTWLLLRASFGTYFNLSHRLGELKKQCEEREVLYKNHDFIKDENGSSHANFQKGWEALEEKFRPFFNVQKANDLLADSFSEKELNLLLHHLRTNEDSLRRISRKIRAIEHNRKKQHAATGEIFQSRKEGDVDLAQLQDNLLEVLGSFREKEQKLIQELRERISKILENEEIDESELESQSDDAQNVMEKLASQMQLLAISVVRCQKALSNEIADHPLKKMERVEKLLRETEEKLEREDRVLWTEKDERFADEVKKVCEDYEALKAQSKEYNGEDLSKQLYEDFNNRVNSAYKKVLRLKNEGELLWEPVRGCNAKWFSTESQFSRWVKEFLFDLPFFGKTAEPIEKHPQLQQHRFTQLQIQNLLEETDNKIVTTDNILVFGFRWLPLAILYFASSFFLYYYPNPWIGLGVLGGDVIMTLGRFLINIKMEQYKKLKQERKLQRLLLSPSSSNDKYLFSEQRRLRIKSDKLEQRIAKKNGVSEKSLAERQKIKTSLDDIDHQLQGVSRDPFYSRSKEVPGNRPHEKELREVERKFGLNLDATEMTKGRDKDKVSKNIENPKAIAKQEAIAKQVEKMAPVEEDFKETLVAALDLTESEANKAYGNYLFSQKRDLKAILETSNNREAVEERIEEIDKKLEQMEFKRPKKKKKSKIKQSSIDLVEKYCRLSEEQREQIPEKTIHKLVTKLNVLERKKVYWSLPQKLREFMEDLSRKEFQKLPENTLSFEGI